MWRLCSQSGIIHYVFSSCQLSLLQIHPVCAFVPHDLEVCFPQKTWMSERFPFQRSSTLRDSNPLSEFYFLWLSHHSTVWLRNKTIWYLLRFSSSSPFVGLQTEVTSVRRLLKVLKLFRFHLMFAMWTNALSDTTTHEPLIHWLRERSSAVYGWNSKLTHELVAHDVRAISERLNSRSMNLPFR